MKCTRRPHELLVTSLGIQVSWSEWGHCVVHHVSMDVRSHTTGPGGDVGPPWDHAFAEALFRLWDESGVDSIEERLDAIVEMIRSWDWRTNIFAEYEALRLPPRVPMARPKSE